MDVEVLVESVDDQTLSTIFEVLSHSDRCALIAALSQSEESLPLSDAAKEVARRNNVEADGPVTRDQIEEKYLLLRHKHVPKLIDSGIIHRDDADNTIRLTEEGEEIADVQAEIFRSNSITWDCN